jgi:chemotaxis protein histidine kinase CheA
VSETFEDRLAALRQRFRSRAMGDSEALERIASDLDGAAPRAELQAEIRRIAHSLAGAGGTFGFSRISACAGELEDLVSANSGSRELAEACRALISEIGQDA